MKEVPGILSVHDLHVWSITSGLDCLSAHVVASDEQNRSPLLKMLQDMLHEKFGIDHLTIQIKPEVPNVLPKSKSRKKRRLEYCAAVFHLGSFLFMQQQLSLRRGLGIQMNRVPLAKQFFSRMVPRGHVELWQETTEQ